MIKRTLYFGNPAYLSLRNRQMMVQTSANGDDRHAVTHSIPIEDVGVIVLDNRQITITQGLLEALCQNKCAVIVCGTSHMPVSLQLPLDGNTLQSERFTLQINASLPLKKQLWQQTIQAKIQNQAAVLKAVRNCETGNMLAWATQVKSGDSNNLEGRAAAYYWRNMFTDISGFTRCRDGIPPNNLLNYGYAILRAIVARSLVVNGLLPTLGIHHHNRYNAYCLADDIMEPYRPYVDAMVVNIHDSLSESATELTTAIKAQLLSIPVLDVAIDGEHSPLMNAVAKTTFSLFKCFQGSSRKIIYPQYVDG